MNNFGCVSALVCYANLERIDWPHIRKFYSQFNNIMSVSGKDSHEMTAVHLLKAHCLSTLTHCCENSVLCESDNRKVEVIWNNNFHHIFSCCSLALSMSNRSESKLQLWKKLFIGDSITLSTVAQMTFNPLKAVGSMYGVASMRPPAFVSWLFFDSKLTDIFYQPGFAAFACCFRTLWKLLCMRSLIYLFHCCICFSSKDYL